jgi:leader peptidase (prepilin peptidase) / N-methyltransferase
MPVEIASWIWPVAVAPFVGSFLGVVATRLDAPRSILLGRSMCPACGHRLSPRDLVPILSWLAAWGRCRHCSATVSTFYPAIEAAALGVAIWSACLVSGGLLWLSCLLGWTLLALIASDFKYFLLPDFLTLPLLAAGLAAGWAFDPDSARDRVVGAASGFLVIVALRQAYWHLRRREGIGLGDAKLFAAAGAWVSWSGLPSVMLIAVTVALAGVLLRQWRDADVAASDSVPFGAFLSLGIWLVWLYGPLELV